MRKLILLFFAISMSFMAVYAQSTISGTVKDALSGEPLFGVNVFAKGNTNIGTTTDFDGKFNLDVPADVNTIVVRAVGYKLLELATEGSNFNIKLEPESYQLDDVIVTASKRKERILDAPASVSVITAERIANTAATTAVDHLKKVPGVDIMKTGLVASNVNVRGFNGIFSGSLLNLVDYRIARVPSLKVNAYQLIPSNNMDIERMELVRGPGSALYGPNAADGVLHILTKSPLALENNFETSVGITAGIRANGEFDKYDPAVGEYTFQEEDKGFADRILLGPEFWHAGKVSEKFGYKLSGGFFTGNDWEYYDQRETVEGSEIVFGTVSNGQLYSVDSTRESQTFARDFSIKKFNVDLRTDFALSDDVDLTLSGGLANTKNIELTGLGAAQSLGWTYGYGQARLRWKDLFLGYFSNLSNSGDETYLIPQAADDVTFQLLNDKSKLHAVTLQHSSTVAKNKLNLIYGADILMTRPETSGTINGRFEDNDNINQYGVYFQGKYDISPKFSILGALRGDYHDVIDEFQVSPRGALVFKANNKHSTRLTYNRAFSSPSSLNLFLDLSNGEIPTPFPTSVRGIGNPTGYAYQYGADGNPQFINSWTGGYQDVTDNSQNETVLNGMVEVIKAGLLQTGIESGSLTADDQILVDLLGGILMAGILTPLDSLTPAQINGVDFLTVAYDQLAGGRSLEESTVDYTQISDREAIESTVTQTIEIGHKGSIKDKFFFTTDGYYTKITNFVSPLTNIAPSVIFNPNSFNQMLAGQQFIDNVATIEAVGGALVLPLLDGNPTYGGIENGTVYDEMVTILNGANAQLTAGTVSPKSVDNEVAINNDAILTYVNLGEVEVFGFDFGGNYYVNDNFNIASSFSFVNKDRIDVPGAANGFVALNAPKYKTSLGLDHTLTKSGFGYGVTWRWQDAFPANSAVYVGNVKAANLVDLSLRYRPNFKGEKNRAGLLFSLDLDNVLNYKHQRFPGTPKIGRMGMAKVVFTFK